MKRPPRCGTAHRTRASYVPAYGRCGRLPAHRAQELPEAAVLSRNMAVLRAVSDYEKVEQSKFIPVCTTSVRKLSARIL